MKGKGKRKGKGKVNAREDARVFARVRLIVRMRVKAARGGRDMEHTFRSALSIPSSMSTRPSWWWRWW